MFPKQYRLNAKEIQFVARRGKRSEFESYIQKVWFDDTLDFPKFAIIVSKKVDKRATERNRQKRVLREKILQNAKEGKYKLGKYIFVIKDYRQIELKTKN